MCLLVENETPRIRINSRAPWVAQLVKHRTLGLGSRRDLRVMRSSPASGSVLIAESAKVAVSLHLHLPLHLLICSLSLHLSLK